MDRLREENFEYRDAVNCIKTLKKYGDKLSNYPAYKKDARFNNLLVLYSMLNPNWREDYLKVEKRKPIEIRTPLTARKIKDIIDAGQGSGELLEVFLSLHAANKIAHTCGRYRDVIVEEYLKSKVNSGEMIANVLDADNMKFIFRMIERYFDPSNKEDEDTLNWTKGKLAKYGINQSNLDDLKALDIEYLSIGQRDGYYIKDYEMDRAIQILKMDDEISYGKFSKDMIGNNGKPILDSDGNPKKEHLLVVDLPYYGQFSIHMKTGSSISALSNTPYDKLRIHEKETVILTDDISNWAKKLIDGKPIEKVMNKLKHIRRSRKNGPRIAHYTALKMGATKEELDNLYSDDDQR